MVLCKSCKKKDKREYADDCFACDKGDQWEAKRHRSLNKPKTNADRIRKMTDEELSNWYFDKFFPYVPYCSILDECPEHDDCKICLLGWLKEES